MFLVLRKAYPLNWSNPPPPPQKKKKRLLRPGVREDYCAGREAQAAVLSPTKKFQGPRQHEGVHSGLGGGLLLVEKASARIQSTHLQSLLTSMSSASKLQSLLSHQLQAP